MSIDVDKLDQGFRIALVAVAFLLGGLDYWTQSENPWIRSLFVISVAGLVGYFTNFLAIKMLFQPKRGKVLGWSGLVPKNQAQIAQSLGESIQEQLLSPDVILMYIRDHSLIEKATLSMGDWVDDRLRQPAFRRQITEHLLTLLNSHGSDWMLHGFNLSEQGLKRASQSPELIAEWWQQLRTALLQYLTTQDNRQLAARRLHDLIHTQIPQIAGWLNLALDQYLSKKNAVGSFGLGLKSLLALDHGAIESLLTRFVDDPRVGEQFMVMLDATVDRVQGELESPETQERIQKNIVPLIEQLTELSRKHVLPATINEVTRYLNDESNWDTIEKNLIGALDWLKKQVLDYLTSEAGQSALKSVIERAVSQLNVTRLVEEQVMELDTDELEDLVLNNTGGNLTIIQVLGGALGIIAGTVQVHLAFALPIGLLFLSVYVAWRINERKQSSH